MVAGGITVGRRVQKAVKDAQAQQKQLCADFNKAKGPQRKPREIAVDKQFAKRLLKILSMWVLMAWDSSRRTAHSLLLAHRRWLFCLLPGCVLRCRPQLCANLGKQPCPDVSST